MPRARDRPPLSNPKTGTRTALPARKRLGQHFLTDPNLLQKIVRAAAPAPGEAILEIGPGRGHLTRALADTGAQVAAVEVDRDLAAELRGEFSTTPNVLILAGNFLERPPEAWLAAAQLTPPYAVVANLPYYITSAILRALLEASSPPTRLVVMVQREVAQQIVAKPPHMSLLGVSVQFYGTPVIIGIVPAGAFLPRPQVDSAIVRIDVSPAPPHIEPELFFRVVRAGFGAKRKQLRNALANGLGLPSEQAAALLARAGIDPARRAETLSLAEWEHAARAAQYRSDEGKTG